MQVELRAVDSIKPYANNPRKNDSAVDAVARSITDYGFRQPIVVDADGVIVVGHTRWKAAQKLGITQVPVHVAVDLPPEKAKAYRLADNQVGSIAEWDYDILPVELGELKDLGVDITNLGFDDTELAEIFAPPGNVGLVDPDDVPAPPDAAVTQPGDLWILGNHRLLCGDSSKPEDLDRLLDGAVIHLCNTDPPYNVKVEPRSNNAIAAGLSSFSAPKGSAESQFHTQGLDLALHPEKSKPTGRKLRAKDRPLANDFMSDEAFDQMLDAWFGNIARVLVPGGGFYIWGGYANCGNYPPVLKKHGLYFSQAVIWDKQHPVLTRKDFMGAHEWCQPAEAQVQTPDGYVSIASLRGGDRVVSYSRDHHSMVGLREGLPVHPTSRPYRGQMYSVRVGEKVTHCTAGHLWSIKLSAAAGTHWCVYLMRKGDWWRVGKSKLLSTCGFGVRHRLATEGGEEAWILSVHPTNLEATIVEQLTLAEYGIPTTTWSESYMGRRTLADVAALYGRMDLTVLRQRAERVLADHGRNIELPFIRVGSTRRKFSRRASGMARACNLLPEIMMIPVPGRGQTVEWTPIDAVERSTFNGEVYSMDVERYSHYVADGLVTHNCFYGWKEGAAHRFFGPANIPDLWHVKKINPQQMEHLTAKPAELAARAMCYSSKPGENVLDLFGGSGSTLIAAEQQGRRAFLMEIDPLYADVIVDRYQRFTGNKAVLERTGESPIPMKPREANMR